MQTVKDILLQYYRYQFEGFRETKLPEPDKGFTFELLDTIRKETVCYTIELLDNEEEYIKVSFRDYSKVYSLFDLWNQHYRRLPFLRALVEADDISSTVKPLLWAFNSDYIHWLVIKEKERAYKGTECYVNEP